MAKDLIRLDSYLATRVDNVNANCASIAIA
jgi:hypothetical protein